VNGVQYSNEFAGNSNDTKSSHNSPRIETASGLRNGAPIEEKNGSLRGGQSAGDGPREPQLLLMPWLKSLRLQRMASSSGLDSVAFAVDGSVRDSRLKCFVRVNVSGNIIGPVLAGRRIGGATCAAIGKLNRFQM